MKFAHIIFSLIFLLSSCSSYTFKEMESIANRMERFQPRNQDTLAIPNLPASQVAIKASRGHRYPASVGPHKKVEFVKAFSNKKLYFSTMMQQYIKLQGYTQQLAPKINSCPHFHTTYIRLKESKILSSIAKQSWSKEYAQEVTPEIIARNPELALPITYNSKGPRVTDLKERSTKEGVQMALAIYLKKMHVELTQLCETGVTDNYYTFENLYLTKEIKLSVATSKSIQVLLKTPLYLNELLIKSLGKSHRSGIMRGIASQDKHRVRGTNIFFEVNSRFKTKWFEIYINQL